MNDWAAEWAAFNVGVELARSAYDAIPNLAGQKKAHHVWHPSLAELEWVYRAAFRRSVNTRFTRAYHGNATSCGTMGVTTEKRSDAGLGPDAAPAPTRLDRAGALE